MKRYLHAAIAVFILFIPSLLLPSFVLSQHPRRSNPARRISEAPRIDGRIDEDCWKSLPLFENFIQWGPYNGEPPSQKTEVRVGYDDEAIYIAGLCSDSSPQQMRSEIGKSMSRSSAPLSSLFWMTMASVQGLFC